jgi:formylmethanofuran dehydrogenase subunit D
VLALALAKPAPEGDNLAAFTATGDVVYFHKVMSFHSAAEGIVHLPAVAYAAGRAFTISPPTESSSLTQ